MISEELIKFVLSVNLRKVMTERKVTELMLANETEISQSAINRIKNGQVCPSLHQALLIASALNTTIDELISGTLDEQSNTSSYIPILNSTDLINKGEKNIIGYCTNDAPNTEAIIAFKCDDSFSSNALNENSVIIIRVSKKQISKGSILFTSNKKYMIGNLQDKIVRSLDNLQQTFSTEHIHVIGQILKIETAFIKETCDVGKFDSILKNAPITNTLDQVYQDITTA